MENRGCSVLGLGCREKRGKRKEELRKGKKKPSAEHGDHRETQRKRRTFAERKSIVE
jgi:hypothetical protein